MASVTFAHVTKSYGNVEVVPPLDLEIRDGEFLVLVGPSGSGKTTTLRMLAGLETVTSGSIRIENRDVTNASPGARGCAMVFQNYALYPHMTVRDNIGYAMKVHGERAGVIKSRVDEVTTLLGLGPYLDRKPRALSGGQRQRVAIGRAIVRQPDVFLFDEPLSNLDAKLRVETRSEIRNLQRRLATTAVYVTHDQVEAMTMADRVAVMNHGRIEQVADPITLYERPVNRFVANFIGSPAMNFFDVVLHRGEIALGEQTLKLADADRQRLGDGLRRIIFGIRPEHFREQGQPLCLVPEAIEPLGAYTLIIGKVGDTRVVAQMPPRVDAEIGRPFAAPVDMNEAHFFDVATNMRL
ncbi:MAG: sn-glycerol-3-phosphate ABC transporter ATP-binding protein UgpC [Rhodobacteraceae bacterium]|nr:sn-glycerol-3-phosphate ABC transporter ATP-binding protein UgpC [Paracoccaceae bacterium]